jgi:diadenosine tetraphosphate (Ap4A) HIT family hydrolase
MPPETRGPETRGEAGFAVDPAILGGSRPLASLPLCEARLQDDARWPWIVLVPRRIGHSELDDLSADERGLLMGEIVLAGRAVRALGRALGRPIDKLNTGALGNLTPQLHVHVVGRRRDDAAWPGPVWGVGTAQAYDAAVLEQLRTAALGVLIHT